jgi:hypothetical protein
MLALVLAAVVSTSSIPALDISTGCKPASPMEDQDINYKSCMQDEEATKQKLAKEWGSYPVAARQECVSDRSSLVDSYVELLTCIEMQTWKNDPNTMNPGNGPATGPGGTAARRRCLARWAAPLRATRLAARQAPICPDA